MNNNATLRFVVYDLLGDFKQLYDDADISPFKMTYWVLVHADRLRKQHIEKHDASAYLQRFDVPVRVNPTTGRNYFELPVGIYDMPNDAAIKYITYAPEIDLHVPVLGSVVFTRTTPTKARRLYFREDERPSPSNPYFYRENKYVILLGIEQLNITTLETGLIGNLNPADVDMDIDQPFDFPQDLIPVLKRQVLDMGRFVLMLPKDLTNDGTASGIKDVPSNKLISVNDISSEQDAR